LREKRKKKYPRRIFYIKKDYQRSVILKFLSAIAAGIILKNIILYYYLEKVINDSLEEAAEITAYIVLGPLVKANILIASSGLVVFLLLLLRSNYKLGVNVSRLSLALHQVEKGNLTVRIEGLNCLLLGDFLRIFNSTMSLYNGIAKNIMERLTRVEILLNKDSGSTVSIRSELLDEISEAEKLLHSLKFKDLQK